MLASLEPVFVLTVVETTTFSPAVLTEPPTGGTGETLWVTLTTDAFTTDTGTGGTTDTGTLGELDTLSS